MNSNTLIPKSILFVCLGNICRSPMAKAVFDYISSTEGNPKSSYTTESVGTAGYHVGEGADRRTLKVCEEKRIPIDHTAKQIHSLHWECYDLIFAMDQNNIQALLQIIPGGYHHKIQLLGAYDPLNPGSEVPDPYYGTMQDFERVYEQLCRISRHLIQRWEE